MTQAIVRISTRSVRVFSEINSDRYCSFKNVERN
ncbi:unnamed protein product [Onchocerca flexuosa]|uniref:Uncharacterized protein n=1 Tax=Onchocerca flexuosa TaxID=387005 RepID=A0A183I0K3_9BILA|nr:unnamed protein product [Onchocerca flexuosa]